MIISYKDGPDCSNSRGEGVGRETGAGKASNNFLFLQLLAMENYKQLEGVFI
jgi:hypothetical protein